MKLRNIFIALVSLVYIAAVATCGIYAATHQTFLLDQAYYGSSEQINIDAAEYEQLVDEKASFVLFVDMTGCITAEGLRTMTSEIAAENQIQFLHIMWPEAKTTSLHGPVKYYPSIVIVHNGEIVDFLQADSDEDAKYYNSKDELANWLMHYINL